MSAIFKRVARAVLITLCCLLSAVPASAEPARRVTGLDVTNAWVRAMPPGASVASGYLNLLNIGKKEQRLVSLSSPLAQTVEIHGTTMVNGQMQMRPIKNGLSIPAGEILELSPSGQHLMLIGIKQDFVPGMVVPLSLVMADGSVLELKIPVRDATQDAAAAAAQEHQHEHHH